MNAPITIKIDPVRRTLDMALPAGDIYDLPLDEERTPVLIDRLRESGVTRIVVDVPEGLEHPLVGALRDAGMTVAAGRIHPS